MRAKITRHNGQQQGPKFVAAASKKNTKQPAGVKIVSHARSWAAAAALAGPSDVQLQVGRVVKRTSRMSTLVSSLLTFWPPGPANDQQGPIREGGRRRRFKKHTRRSSPQPPQPARGAGSARHPHVPHGSFHGKRIDWATLTLPGPSRNANGSGSEASPCHDQAWPSRTIRVGTAAATGTPREGTPCHKHRPGHPTPLLDRVANGSEAFRGRTGATGVAKLDVPESELPARQRLLVVLRRRRRRAGEATPWPAAGAQPERVERPGAAGCGVARQPPRTDGAGGERGRENVWGGGGRPGRAQQPPQDHRPFLCRFSRSSAAVVLVGAGLGVFGEGDLHALLLGEADDRLADCGERAHAHIGQRGPGRSGGTAAGRRPRRGPLFSALSAGERRRGGGPSRNHSVPWRASGVLIMDESILQMRGGCEGARGGSGRAGAQRRWRRSEGGPAAGNRQLERRAAEVCGWGRSLAGDDPQRLGARQRDGRRGC